MGGIIPPKRCRTNFTRYFVPLSGSDPKIERATERYLLTTFTYGCNLGSTQAARYMRGLISAKELAFVNRRHVTIDKLSAALVDIVNRYKSLNLPTIWGDGTRAAADGTKYETNRICCLSIISATGVMEESLTTTLQIST